ncbi:hypothetical protein LIER_33947 [Lithospermum erythrorhizon]|uniref:Non-specific lipid-transfer protein n=1 Tax=Lithospermum erythrorhizon TaxID=34254 RepID=A0AAV3S0D8_LITER
MEFVGKVALFVLLSMVVVAPHAEAAITCGQVTNSLAPCFPYLTSNAPLTPLCCGGVKGLYSAAKTTPDRQAACRCIKSLQSSVTSINVANAAALPGKCGVSLPYKISPSIDCNK